MGEVRVNVTMCGKICEEFKGVLISRCEFRLVACGVD